MKKYLSDLASSAVRKDDLQRIKAVGLDPSAVTERVGSSNLQSRVYRYENDKIVKIPRIQLLTGTNALTAIQDLNFLQEHLAEFVPHTEIYRSQGDSDFAVLQQYLPGAINVKTTSPDNVIHSVVELINESIRLMEKFGKMPVLVGAEEVVDIAARHFIKQTPQTTISLGNVVSITGGTVFLVDTTVLGQSRNGLIPFTSLVANKIYAEQFRDQAISRLAHTITPSKSYWLH